MSDSNRKKVCELVDNIDLHIEIRESDLKGLLRIEKI